MEAKPQQLYPCETVMRMASQRDRAGDQSFRLARISEIDNFLSKEVEARRKIQKKYQRAINIAQAISTGTSVVTLGMEAAEITLIATGIGTVPGMILSGLGAGAFSFTRFACDKIQRKCAAKAEKHAAICQTSRTKLNSIHQLVSTALSDQNLSDEEFKTISAEYDRYLAMKEELRAKARGVDNTTKKEWLEQGRAEVRAEFSKFISDVPQK